MKILSPLLGNEVQLVIATIGVGVPQVQGGKAVPLAALGEKRLPELPNVPLASQVGVMGFGGLLWAAILARAGTPDAAVRKMYLDSQQFLSDPESIKKLEKLQMEHAPGPPDAYETVLANDMKKWEMVTRGLKRIMDQRISVGAAAAAAADLPPQMRGLLGWAVHDIRAITRCAVRSGTCSARPC